MIRFQVPHAASDDCAALCWSNREQSKHRNALNVSASGKCTIIGCHCKLIMRPPATERLLPYLGRPLGLPSGTFGGEITASLDRLEIMFSLRYDPDCSF
jgi:hypothetical protein